MPEHKSYWELRAATSLELVQLALIYVVKPQMRVLSYSYCQQLYKL